MADRPTGAVTFLFTDVVGSTAAWETDPTAMNTALEVHDTVLRSAIESHHGFVFATGGDSFSAAFSSPTSALAAAIQAQRGLTESNCGVKARMGVHSGEAIERDGNYFGPSLNQTARLMSIGHGGQILVSDITRGLVATAGFDFLDLGDHRLADLSKPVRLAQLVAEGLEASFPPLRSMVATDNLPRIGQVFGRSTDIDRVTDLLAVRSLVTLTGAGGIGKTTLAVSVASKSTDQFPDGRWLVDLTDLPSGSDRTAIAGAVAGVDERFDGIDALAPRQMLMILDNCEHVLDGARSYLTDLLAAARDVTVLATSREPLGLREERNFPVAPLSVDEGSEHASAVDLFIERADEAGVTIDLKGDGEAVAAICREVGGLPLAIELAAARTAVMSPSQILDRLSDRLSLLRGGTGGPEHHSTIEATIAWSYDLLDDDTKRLLRFLSVFEGGFDLEQAEAIGGNDAVDHLTDLVRKSLIHRHDNRFGMLEAVRQYAGARLLQAREEDEARQQHFDYFASWAHTVYHRDELIELTDEEREWITVNLTSLRNAVAYGAQRAQSTRAAELGVVLWPHLIEVFYDRWDHEDWFAPLLGHLDQLDQQLQIGVLHGSGTMAMWSGDLDQAEELLHAEYRVHQETGRLLKSGGPPQNNLAILAMIQGRWSEAERLYREGIEALKEHQRPHHNTSGNLARLVCYVRDDPNEALDIVRQARELDHLNSPWEVAGSRLNEANILIENGTYEEAWQLTTESLRYFRQHHLRLDQQVWALLLLSLIAYETGEDELSSKLLLEVVDMEATEGLAPFWHSPGAIHLARVLLDRGARNTARRVMNEFRSQEDHMEPVHLRRLQEQEARLGPVASEPEDNIALVDAVRNALEASTKAEHSA